MNAKLDARLGMKYWGKLISEQDSLLQVRCLLPVGESLQNKVCKTCLWHIDPRRQEGWVLYCLMDERSPEFTSRTELLKSLRRQEEKRP